MKGCLKSPLPSPGSESNHVRKCVAFEPEGTEQVHIADEWDRTPMEPARKLTYQDMLEFRAIQRSLPHASQPVDPLSSRPGSQYLSTVPIGLLPLLSDTDSGRSRESSAAPSPTLPSPGLPFDLPSVPHTNANMPSSMPTLPPPPRPSSFTQASASIYASSFSISSRPRPSPVEPPIPMSKPPASSTTWHPPHMAHLVPTRPPPPRPRTSFPFLPLLDTPPTSNPGSAHSTPPLTPFASCPPSPTCSTSSSDSDADTEQEQDAQDTRGFDTDASSSSQDPPTPSLTNASLDSSPLSRASSASPEPPFFQLPPGRRGVAAQGVQVVSGTYLGTTYSTTKLEPLGSAALSIPSPFVLDDAAHKKPPMPPARSSPPPSEGALSAEGQGQAKPKRPRNFIVVNGIEIDLDDEEAEAGTPSGSLSNSAVLERPSPPAPARLSPSPPRSASNLPTAPREGSPSPHRPTSPSVSGLRSRSPPSPSSPQNRCARSLHSPILFHQNAQGPRPTAI